MMAETGNENADTGAEASGQEPGTAEEIDLEELKSRADQDDADAQFHLGEMYEEGRGLPMDERRAAWWYRKAAVQGHADAQCSLGVMYASGRGVVQDDVEAVKWYRLAAAQGDAEAQCLLGMAHGLGRGVPRNIEESKKWYRKMVEPAAPPAPPPAET